MGLAKRYVVPRLDELKPSVFQGVWERYDEPPYQSLKWTLENFSAILVMACVTSLIALAQSQCWRLLRYIIAQFNKSLRLPDDSTPDPLLEISQGHAVRYILPILSRWISRLFANICRPFRAERHTRDTHVVDDPVESPYFGIASILNISFFLVMGVAIPCWLTEGALGTPIVKSRSTEGCLKSNSTSHWVDSVNRLKRADNIFDLCQDRLNAGCDSPYYLSNSSITKTRSIACPFKGRICLGNTAPFEITHWNISAFEMGVNSKSKLFLNRRLTCAPISLNPFLSRTQDSNGSFIYIRRAYFNQTVKLWPNISLTLSTKNGPDFFSNEDSGLRMAQEEGPHDLTILPSNPGITELNELIERDDGQSFLVIYRAGRRLFENMIHDPFFAAHRHASFEDGVFPNQQYFYPDHEATALGCVEQFQCCLLQSSSSNHCTQWGTSTKTFSEMYDYLAAQFPGGFNGNISPEFEQWNDPFAWSLKEMLVLYKSVSLAFEVHRYLGYRTSAFKMVPLIRWGSMTDYRSFEVNREPWVAEVETWFVKSFLSGILMVQDGSLFALKDLDPAFSPKYIREWALCGRILFHNGDYTNIDWIGLWATVAPLTVICLVGNQVQAIHREVKYYLKFLSRRMRVVISWLQKFPRTIQSLKRPVIWFRRPITIWSVFLLFQSLSRRWRWYGSDSGSGGGRASGLRENSNDMEMDGVEESSATPRQDNSNDIQEFEDIDDPI